MRSLCWKITCCKVNIKPGDNHLCRFSADRCFSLHEENCTSYIVCVFKKHFPQQLCKLFFCYKKLPVSYASMHMKKKFEIIEHTPEVTQGEWSGGLGSVSSTVTAFLWVLFVQMCPQIIKWYYMLEILSLALKSSSRITWLIIKEIAHALRSSPTSNFCAFCELIIFF